MIDIAAHPQKNRIFFIFIALFTILVWSAPLFTTPTFDLDEALYRQSAQEMKRSHNYFNLTWSGETYFDKPPTHVWSIVAVSKLIDRDENHVSVLAAKIPSLLATYLTLLFACVFWKKAFPLFKSRLEKKGARFSSHVDSLNTPWLVPLFFGMALLPTAGSSSVIIDPLLMMAFSPFFLLLTYHYIKGDGKIISLPFSSKLIMALSMSFACALKGPIGLLLPAWSVVFHEIIAFIFQKEETAGQFFSARFVTYLKQFGLLFLISTAFSALYFYLIYLYGGSDFIYNFFVVQNVERGLRPFEGHGGSFFYHWIVVFLGGGLLTPFVVISLIKALKDKTQKGLYGLWGYPLSWSVSMILFYCCMATKLPNYTWPVWIGLSTAAALLLVMRTNTASYKATSRLPFLWYSAMAAGGAALCFAVPVFLAVLSHVSFDSRVQVVVDSIMPIPFSVSVSFVMAGLLLLCACVWSVKLQKELCPAAVDKKDSLPLKYVAFTAVSVSLVILTLCLGVVPFVKNVYWLPFVHSSHFVEEQIKIHGGKFATIGLNSPTVSSTFDLFYVPQFPRKDIGTLEHQVDYVLVPKWIEPECLTHGYEIIRTDYYLSVCHFKN